jgi:hypothetical protein
MKPTRQVENGGLEGRIRGNAVYRQRRQYFLMSRYLIEKAFGVIRGLSVILNLD